VFVCAFSPCPAASTVGGGGGAAAAGADNVQVLATGSGDGTVRVWTLTRQPDAAGAAAPSTSLAQRTTASSVVLHHGASVGQDAASSAMGASAVDVSCLDWTADGKALATGSYDSRVRLWNPSSGDLLAVCAGHAAPILCVRFSPDGSRLVSASVDKTAIVWSALSGQPQQQQAFHTAPVLDADWQTNNVFASCSSDGTVLLCQVGDRAPLRSWTGHRGEVNAVRWDPAKTRLASCSDDGTARIWLPSAASPEAARVLQGHSAALYSLQWAPRGEGSRNPDKGPLLATASFDASVRVWDPETGECRFVLAGGHSGMVYSLAWSPDGDYLASGSADRSVNVWSMRDGSLVRSYTGPSGVFELDFCTFGAAGTEDAALTLAAGFADASVVLLDMKA
jgi:transducin (beta)-like 1